MPPPPGHRQAALAAYRRVPDSSSGYLDAQLARVRLLLRGAGTTTPTLDELSPPTIRRPVGPRRRDACPAHRGGAGGGPRAPSPPASSTPDPDEGCSAPVHEAGVRLGLEQSYRRLARCTRRPASASGWSTRPTAYGRGRGHERPRPPVETPTSLARRRRSPIGALRTTAMKTPCPPRACRRVGLVAVVCDGVSLSQAPDQAARAGRGRGGPHLADGLRRGEPPGRRARRSTRSGAAQRAVSEVGHSPGEQAGPALVHARAGRVCRRGSRRRPGWVTAAPTGWGPTGCDPAHRDNSWASQQVDVRRHERA